MQVFEILCKTISRNLPRIFSLITITHNIEVKVTANAKLGIITYQHNTYDGLKNVKINTTTSDWNQFDSGWAWQKTSIQTTKRNIMPRR